MSKFEEIVLKTLFVIAILMVSIPLIFLIKIYIDYHKNEKNQIDSGIVVDKSHSEEHSQLTKFGRVHYPEKFTLTISGKKNGELVTYEFECSKDDFEIYNIGDRYPNEMRGKE